ncbi:MAG: DUF3782 domain-containing protein [Deltaproteobacteria bacterium]
MTTSTSELSWDDLKAMLAGLIEQGRETDRRMQETDRLIRELREESRETDQQIKELGKQIAGLGDKFGYFTEGMALPSLERILEERFGMEHISPRHRVRSRGKEREYDVLAWANDKVKSIVLVEVKSRVKREAVDQLLAQLDELPELLPELTQGKVRMGILAGVDWDQNVAEAAQAAGLYTARIHGNLFELTVPEGFKPRQWLG